MKMKINNDKTTMNEIQFHSAVHSFIIFIGANLGLEWNDD